MWHREHEEDRNRDGVQRRQPVLLAEYASVSNEIHRRSDAQQPLIALTITALATITGIVVGKSSARGLILLLPLVSSTCTPGARADKTSVRLVTGAVGVSESASMR